MTLLFFNSLGNKNIETSQARLSLEENNDDARLVSDKSV